MWSSANTIRKTKMLSTDSDSSSRYAAKYSAAAVGGCVMAIHTPTASPSETHHATQRTLRFVAGTAATGGVIAAILSRLRRSGANLVAARHRQASMGGISGDVGSRFPC